MSWIETEDGYVNLATARRIAMNVHGGHYLVDQNGETHSLPHHVDPEIALAPIVPDTRSLLHEIWYDAGGVGDLGEETTWVETYCVIGWRIIAGQGARPIIPGKEVSGSQDCMVVIEMPDGGCFELDGDNTRHESLDAARQALMERCQKRATS
jgi:hypothetical protein